MIKYFINSKYIIKQIEKDLQTAGCRVARSPLATGGGWEERFSYPGWETPGDLGTGSGVDMNLSGIKCHPPKKQPFYQGDWPPMSIKT